MSTQQRRPLRLGLVGPLPPPNGGMAMQTRQLARLLPQEGVEVQLLQTNAAYRPGLVKNVPVLRALFRLLPYLWQTWRLAGRVDVIHLMANSGWSWQLFSAPVLWVGWLRGTPVIVNYRGGEAQEYLQRSSVWVKPSLAKAAQVVVPSGFLQNVFAQFGIATKIVPNIIDLDLFHPAEGTVRERRFTVVITRNLEPIYGLDTAIRCIALVRQSIPGIALKIAGSGPQLAQLQRLVEELELTACISFLGRQERADIVALYQSADVMLNPSLVDNMPNSVLEALACGVPVISTNVGGVPHIVEDGRTALLVHPKDPTAMAASLVRLYADTHLQQCLREAGLQLARDFAWPLVKAQWLELYRSEAVAA